MAEIKTGIEIEKHGLAWSAQIWVGLRVTDHNTGGTCTDHKIYDVEMSCAEFVDQEGWCVTVTPTSYTYTNGNEPGAVVGAIAYPRYPTPEDVLTERTLRLAKKLLVDLHQTFVTVVIQSGNGDKTFMVTDHDRYNLNERNRKEQNAT